MAMTPEQFNKLRELGKLFEQGIAKPEDIEELSELLAMINQNGTTMEPVDLDLNPILKNKM